MVVSSLRSAVGARIAVVLLRLLTHAIVLLRITAVVVAAAVRGIATFNIEEAKDRSSSDDENKSSGNNEVRESRDNAKELEVTIIIAKGRSLSRVSRVEIYSALGLRDVVHERGVAKEVSRANHSEESNSAKEDKEDSKVRSSSSNTKNSR